jgi:hypothetical protein
MDRSLIALIRYQLHSLQSVGHHADSLLAGVFDKLPALIFLSHYTLSDCKTFFTAKFEYRGIPLTLGGLPEGPPRASWSRRLSLMIGDSVSVKGLPAFLFSLFSFLFSPCSRRPTPCLLPARFLTLNA